MQLLNLFPIDGLELTLKKIKMSGLTGMTSVIERSVECWVKDIYANQMHRVISGAAPFRGLSNIGAGIHDLLFIPAKEYKQAGTGKMMRELRKSSSSLIRTVTKEALQATSQLSMMLAKGIADLASDGQSSTRRIGPSRGRTVSKQNTQLTGYANSREQTAEAKAVRQPSGLREGLERAVDSVSREVSQAVETVVCVPIRQYSQRGPSGVVTSAIRALPVAVLRPMAGAAEALSYTLLGLRNDLDPQSRRDEEDLFNVDLTPARTIRAHPQLAPPAARKQSKEVVVSSSSRQGVTAVQLGASAISSTGTMAVAKSQGPRHPTSLSSNRSCSK
jgi:autophagy-related protein 2